MPFDSHPSDRTLEAIYNINKHAKKYAERADTYYHTGKKATAHKNSVRKEALYTVKTKVLNQCLPHVSRVERHNIDGDTFLCLFFEDGDGEQWSFHQPANRVHDEWIPDDVEVSESKDLENFDAGSEKERSDMNLNDALPHLENLGYSANDYLRDEYIDYGRNSYFAGWEYLDS